ncbi:MAG: hypothetical protein H6713_36230 [Myxococcales bacterium]|nr:hypothetical protein [Myxococcales bacterium]
MGYLFGIITVPCLLLWASLCLGLVARASPLRIVGAANCAVVVAFVAYFVAPSLLIHQLGDAYLLVKDFTLIALLVVQCVAAWLLLRAAGSVAPR